MRKEERRLIQLGRNLEAVYDPTKVASLFPDPKIGRPRRSAKAEEARKDGLRKLAKQVRKEFKPQKLSRKKLAYKVGKRCGLSGTTIKRHYNEILDE